MTGVGPSDERAVGGPWRLGDPYPGDWVRTEDLMGAVAVGNPRRGEVEEIAHSIGKIGWFGRVTVQVESVKQGGGPRILIGNHRFRAALLVGMLRVPVEWIDCDDQVGDKILVADNRYSDLASWDDRELLATLRGLDDLEGTGFSPVDMEALEAALQMPEDDEPEGAGGGRAAPDVVNLDLGVIKFPVAREDYDIWFDTVEGEVGQRHEDQVAEVRTRLGI